VSISPTFYVQLTSKYPKSAKKADDLTVFIALLGSMHVKAARKMLVKLTPAPPSSIFPHLLHTEVSHESLIVYQEDCESGVK